MADIIVLRPKRSGISGALPAPAPREDAERTAEVAANLCAAAMVVGVGIVVLAGCVALADLLLRLAGVL